MRIRIDFRITWILTLLILFICLMSFVSEVVGVEEIGKRSSGSSQTQRVHALLVLAGNDDEITQTVEKSQQTMIELMQLVSRNCEVHLTVMKSMPGLEGEVRYKRLANTEVKAKNSPQQLGIIKSSQVLAWIREVGVTPSDTLLIYFNGHGEMDK